MKILKLMIYLSVVALFSTACNKDEITTSSKAEESAALANPIEQNYLSLLHQLEQEDVTSKASNPLESRSSYSAGSTVYIMSNEINENQVIAFSRGSDGKLNELARYATGGTGNGAGLGSLVQRLHPRARHRGHDRRRHQQGHTDVVGWRDDQRTRTELLGCRRFVAGRPDVEEGDGRLR